VVVVAVLVLHREDDVPFAAGRIQDWLRSRLGWSNVRLPPVLRGADVVVAVVGPYWEEDPILGTHDPRVELHAAAADGIPVVVVEIVSGRAAAAAPRGVAARLEESLPTRSARVEVDGGQFDRGIEDVLSAIRTLTASRGESTADEGQEEVPAGVQSALAQLEELQRVWEEIGPSIRLPERIPAAPGTRTSVQGELRNRSTVVERYDLVVIGEPADWTDVVPRQVSVFPQSEIDFVLTFFPPWSFWLRTDSIRFGLQVSTSPGLDSTAFSWLFRPPVDVFISYAREDTACAETLADLLSQQELVVWWDRSLTPGSQYDEVIEKALEQARCVVVIWSESAVQSDWVRAEANEGANRGVLVPLRIDDARMPLRYRQLHAYELHGWGGGANWPGLDKFVSSIRDRLPANR
jgi:TIR domain